MAKARTNVFIGLGDSSTFTVAGGDEAGYIGGGGVGVRVEREYAEVFTDQSPTIIDKPILTKRAYITVEVHEASLANLVHAWDCGAVSGSTLTVGPTSLGKTDLAFVGIGPDGSARTVTVPIAVSMGNGETSYSTTDKVLIPMEFEAIGDGSTAILLTIVDV